jgi:hypothetical protein
MPELGQHLIKGWRVRRCIIKPSQEIERFIFSEITAVVQAAGNRRQILKTRFDVV